MCEGRGMYMHVWRCVKRVCERVHVWKKNVCKRRCVLHMWREGVCLHVCEEKE